MTAPPDITFVIPFRNEERHLAECCESLAAQELGGYTAEVLLLDGASEDASRSIAEEFAARSYPDLSFRVIDNPRQRTPHAFNIGIARARAAIVGFGGAHAVYPPSYLRRAVELLGSTDAAVVGGGHKRFIPSSPGVLAMAMCFLYQSPLGAGVAPYHRRQTPAYVDTVFGGFYRRSVFDSVGLFNEQLLRNQDNELNSRVTRAGFRILFHPELSTDYIMKTDARVFLARAFRFGYYHPITWRTSPHSFKWRHAVPAAFVLYLLSLLLLPFLPIPTLLAVAPLIVYLLLLAGAGAVIARKSSLATGLASVALFCAFHVGYGVGTLAGIVAAARPRATSPEAHPAS